MKTVTVYAILSVAAMAELTALVSIVKEATDRRPKRTERVVLCDKPWLSPQDERAACEIENAQRMHARSKVRPKWNLETKWSQR